MKVLLDTNIIIFALYRPDELSSKAIEWLSNPQHTFLYSILSLWEIEMKHIKHPDVMPVSANDVESLCLQNSMVKLELRSEHIRMLKNIQLPDSVPSHKDPFDKMLLSQAVTDELIFLTHDSKIPYYGFDCIKFV